MKKSKSSVILILSCFLAGYFFNFMPAKTIAASQDFPGKEISIVVGMTAGGGRDIVMRGLAKTWTKYLGVPIVIVNVPGAGGLRALSQVYRSAPDGHTLLLGGAPEILAQVLEKQDFDMKKCSYVGRVQSSPLFFWVKTDSSLRSLKDFKTLGRPVRQATFSMTSNSTLAAIVLANREGFDLKLIGGYSAAPPSILAIIRGETEFVGTHAASAYPFWRAGQIRPILTIAPNRHPDFPDIPTLAELGHADLSALTMDFWLLAPPGVPADRMQLLDDSLQKAVKDQDFLTFAKGADIEVSALSSQETGKLVQRIFTVFEQYKGDVEKYIRTK